MMTRSKLPKINSLARHRVLFAGVLVLYTFMLSTGVLAQHLKGNINDGPYVLYNSAGIEVKKIVESDQKPLAVSQRFTLKEKANITLQVRFSNRPDWGFDVALKAKLRDEKSQWPQPSLMLALSDIEGEFEAFRNLLISNKVMDEKYNWTFGKGHLVICGDLFDRGMNVNEELWLIYKLEQDAESNGGYVHTILGNHDIMNLSGDVRYVQKKYFDNAALMGNQYMDLFSKNSELGRWLRTKNIVEKIGDNLCLHAGISQKVNELNMSVGQINYNCRSSYDRAETNELYEDEKLLPFFSDETSPFWYRGYFAAPRASQAQVDSTLKNFKCKQIIVGHTIVEANVAAYYQHKVIGIDVNQHEGKHEALLFENNHWFKVDNEGKRKALISYK